MNKIEISLCKASNTNKYIQILKEITSKVEFNKSKVLDFNTSRRLTLAGIFLNKKNNSVAKFMFGV